MISLFINLLSLTNEAVLCLSTILEYLTKVFNCDRVPFPVCKKVHYKYPEIGTKLILMHVNLFTYVADNTGG